MIQRTRLACRLSKPQNCLGLDRGPHLGQRTWCRVNRPDTCSQSTRPSEFSSKLLHRRGRPHITAKAGPGRAKRVRATRFHQIRQHVSVGPASTYALATAYINVGRGQWIARFRQNTALCCEADLGTAAAAAPSPGAVAIGATISPNAISHRVRPRSRAGTPARTT